MEQLIQGLEVESGQQIYLVEMLQSRFMEWPYAAWQLQREFLENRKSPDWRYVGYTTETDIDDLVGCVKHLVHTVPA